MEGVESHKVLVHHKKNALSVEEEVRIHHQTVPAEAEWGKLAAEWGMGRVHPASGMDLGNNRVSITFLKLIDNSSSLTKEGHKHGAGLETLSRFL